MKLAALQDTLADLMLSEMAVAPEALEGVEFLPPTAVKVLNVARARAADGFTAQLVPVFPTAAKIVGEAFLERAGRAFFYHQRPQGPALTDMAANFPDFLDEFEPAAAFPYLADIAALDYGVLKATIAPDSGINRAEELLAIEPTLLLGSAAKLAPSCHWLASSFAICQIWQLYHGAGTSRALDHRTPQNAIIVRQGDTVQVHSASEGMIRVLNSLDRGATIAQALAQGSTTDPSFDPGQAIGFLLQQGLVVDVDGR